MNSLPNKQGMFVSAEGKNLIFTFVLVSSLFLLWGFCNGMIDVMDKHFQEELHLTMAQSAWVQFAHYLGYFLMALPAGWLATRLGYKGGIIAGLLMVAVGGFWFIPATKIAAFWAFLLGVCTIAAGLTFLETVANPYTTVLGAPQYAATRINLAQSCNGVGWLLGPIAGGMFFYSKNAAGQSTGSQTLWIPYTGVAIVVILLSVIFYFASVPDIKTEDVYHLEDKDESAGAITNVKGGSNRALIYCMLLGNTAVMAGAIGMILWVILSTCGVQPVGIASTIPLPAGYAVTADNALAVVISAAAVLAILLSAVLLVPKAKTISTHSIWSRPHFSGATLAQFFYVAAQCGIFSFFINYMTSQVPAIPESWNAGILKGCFEVNAHGVLAISNQSASFLASVGFFCFLCGRVSGAMLLKKYSAHKVLGVFAVANVALCLLIFSKLGWLSVLCVFLCYYFMSITFPTIFALGIHGLGARAKPASGYIVMAIMGGAILPKLMGAVADKYDMSRAFIVPMVCFVFIALYSFNWPKFSQAESLHEVKTSGGH
jgi:MFS transporter, FHS family, L-fucose permease